MTPGKLSRRIVADRMARIDRMLEEIYKLPMDNYDVFLQDSRNVYTAESCLRRSLEALLDMGRHILAKGFGLGVTEYKEIANELHRQGVLNSDNAELLKVLAGYRNRMVHFYNEITTKELFEICRDDIKDILQVKEAFLQWIRRNPERIEETL